MFTRLTGFKSPGLSPQHQKTEFSEPRRQGPPYVAKVCQCFSPCSGVCGVEGICCPADSLEHYFQLAFRSPPYAFPSNLNKLKLTFPLVVSFSSRAGLPETHQQPGAQPEPRGEHRRRHGPGSRLLPRTLTQHGFQVPLVYRGARVATKACPCPRDARGPWLCLDTRHSFPGPRTGDLEQLRSSDERASRDPSHVRNPLRQARG